MLAKGEEREEKRWLPTSSYSFDARQGSCLPSGRMTLANTQGRRARERLLFRNKVREQSSWLKPGGNKRAWGGALSRGFIGS